MIVRDLMTPDPVTVLPEDSLHTARNRMSEIGCRRLPVVDATGRVVGILTDRDLRLAVNSPLVLRERWQDDMLINGTAVDACMTPNPLCIGADEPVMQAAQMMLDHKISGLPVVEQGRLVGVITVTDLVQALIRFLEEPAR